jgi:hypothetical protein
VQTAVAHAAEAASPAAPEQTWDPGSLDNLINSVMDPVTNEVEAPRYDPKASRLQSLAARAQRPQSALEAAQQAELREAEARKVQEANDHAAAVAANPLLDPTADRIQEMMSIWLPEVGPVYVANVRIAKQRDVLTALWKAHRAKFLHGGQLGRAVGVVGVLHALKTVAEDKLMVAHVVTDASDYMVWLDLDAGCLVAAFRDARAYFTGD